MSNIQLSLPQHAILAYAIHNTGGNIEWFPDKINGGARKKVLESLLSRALIDSSGPAWRVSAAAYSALGCEHLAPAPAPQETPATPCATESADPEIEAAVAAAEADWASEQVAPTQARVIQMKHQARTRAHSKQASVIEMLNRTEGATIAQICEATGWQAHTVRGTFANAFKKKLGLAIVSDKPQGGERVYRIA